MVNTQPYTTRTLLNVRTHARFGRHNTEDTLHVAITWSSGTWRKVTNKRTTETSVSAKNWNAFVSHIKQITYQARNCSDILTSSPVTFRYKRNHMTIMQIASGISLHTKKDCRDRWIMQGTCVEASSKSQHALFFFRILATVCAFVSCRS
jgi:hypothetical protein